MSYLLDIVKKQIEKIKKRIKDQDIDIDEKLNAWSMKTDSVDLSKWWQEGIPNIDDVTHGAINPKSTTLKWFGMDNEDFYNKVTPPHAKWHYNKNNVNYTFNRYGYRGDDPNLPADFTVLVSGDSHSFGIGLDDEEVWTHQFKLLLQKQYPKCKIVNLSCPGGSNDWVSRSITCAVDTIKPDLVIPCFTYPNRREAIWDSGYLWQLNTSVPFNPVQTEYEEFQSWFMTVNEHTDYYNLVKNQKLVQKTCRDYGLIETQIYRMRTIQRQLGSIHKIVDVARDIQHFGPRVHKQFAKEMYNTFCTRQSQEKKL